MKAGAVERVPQKGSNPAAPLEDLLASGYFVASVSRGRVGAKVPWEVQPVACSVGLGCRHQRGASAGAPVETLGLLFRALLACQVLGIQQLYCIVGQKLAADSFGNGLAKEEAQRAGKEHARIIQRVAKAAGKVSVTLLMDEEVQAKRQYAEALARVSRNLGTPFDYLARAAALFEVVIGEYAAGPKIGWTRFGERQWQAVPSLVSTLGEGRLPRQSCEVVFDVFRDLAFGKEDTAGDDGSLIEIYGPAAVPFDALVSAACPYVSARESLPTRILLKGSELSNLHWKIPKVDALEPGLRPRMAKSMISLAQLCALTEEVLPGLLPPGQLPAICSEYLRTQRQVEEAERRHGTAGREFTEKSTLLRRLPVERARDVRAGLIPALGVLIQEFAAEA